MTRAISVALIAPSVKPAPRSHADGRHAPEAGCSRQAAHGCTMAEDGAGSEEVDSGHDLRRDAGRVFAFETVGPDESEEGRTETNQHVGAQPRCLVPCLPLKPDQTAENRSEKKAHGPVENGDVSRHRHSLIQIGPMLGSCRFNSRGLSVTCKGYGALMEVEVIRSARRRKTVQARVVDGVLRVAIPAHMTAEEEAHWVNVMQLRLARGHQAREVDLKSRAAILAARYGLPSPESIEWSSRQRTRWGSTTISSRKVRISDRLAGFPTWVIDYVIVHELAHLVESNHTPAFWQLVERYPQTERARGYLIAKGEAGAGYPGST